MKVVFDDGENSYTAKQIAKNFKVTVETVRIWRRIGNIPKPDEIVGGCQYWRESTIDKWVETLKVRSHV